LTEGLKKSNLNNFELCGKTYKYVYHTILLKKTN